MGIKLMKTVFWNHASQILRDSEPSRGESQSQPHCSPGALASSVSYADIPQKMSLEEKMLLKRILENESAK